MSKNIEIKAKIESYLSIYEDACQISDHCPTEIDQDDTFFNCPNGRLKLRVLSETKGELIFYQRPSKDGPKESFYTVYPTISPDTLNESLTLAYGVAGKVRKKRTLFLVGRARIHLDQVEGLGEYVELEVVLGENESVDEGIIEANSLMEKLNIKSSNLIRDAYVDLINRLSA